MDLPNDEELERRKLEQLAQHPITLRMLQLTVLQDALRFVETSADLNEIDYDSLTRAASSIYMACGLTAPEVNVIVHDSLNRIGDRLMAVIEEHR